MGFFDFVSNAFNEVKSGVTHAADAIGLTRVVDKATSTISSAVSSVTGKAESAISTVYNDARSVAQWGGNLVNKTESDLNNRISQGEDMLPKVAMYAGGAIVIGGIIYLSTQRGGGYRGQSSRKRTIADVAYDYNQFCRQSGQYCRDNYQNCHKRSQNCRLSYRNSDY